MKLSSGRINEIEINLKPDRETGSTPRIVVVGSTNVDLVVTVPRFPSPGETVLGSDLRQVAGGKGANQAVAAARMGADVTFVARVGDDDYGRQTLINLQQEGINTRYVLVTPGVASGVALISVQPDSGENSIVVAPGANSKLAPDDITAAVEAFEHARVVVISLEIPLETAHAAILLAKAKRCLVILNPAPAQTLSSELLSCVDILTPNEHESEVLGGTARLLATGVKAVITTLGARGARLETNQESLTFPAPQVNAIDTVAAGDCFTGALAVEVARGSALPDAIRFAIAAASFKVTQHGAQSGMPTRSDVLSRPLAPREVQPSGSNDPT